MTAEETPPNKTSEEYLSFFLLELSLISQFPIRIFYRNKLFCLVKYQNNWWIEKTSDSYIANLLMKIFLATITGF